MSPTTVICHCEPLDTWFFREARPHGSVGNSELGSQFPPPVRTLLGALRTAIGDAWFARHVATGAAWPTTRRCKPTLAWVTTWGRCAPAGRF